MDNKEKKYLIIGIIFFVIDLIILIDYYILVFSVITALFIMAFQKPIDYLIMKNDPIWRKWYKGKFRCPSCLKRLLPHDYPPNYICNKCGGIHSFGDKAVRDWRKNNQ